MIRGSRVLVAVIITAVFGSGMFTPTLKGSQEPLLAALSADLLGLLLDPLLPPSRVLVSGDLPQIEAATQRLGIPILRRLTDAIVVDANGTVINQLRAESAVTSISGDLPVVSSSMSVAERAMAADQARASQRTGLLGWSTIPGVTGRGVGVAVVDSGISPHLALQGRVIAAVSFVPDEPWVEDGFGHGTHIAGIIAGKISPWATMTTAYANGIAPEANLVNVKVLGSNGSGRTSDVIAGIDWVVENRTRYGIRVINLSLGHPVTEPSATDPLHRAVARATSAGLLVVASAGNLGKTADGQPVIGGITSPGNSSLALTVGALNTWDTVDRADDTVATYSSRGPTRYDFAVKPDVVAPGNKIISLEASNAALAVAYPSEHVAGWGTNGYRRMSGTSMAAGMVSGVAALLYESSPNLLPANAKVAVQASSSYMRDEGLVASGAGSVNAATAREMATDGLEDILPTAIIDGRTTIASGVIFQDAGTLVASLYAGGGVRLMNTVELLLTWLNPGRLTSITGLALVGLGNSVLSVPANQIIWGDTNTGGNQILWGDHLTDSGGQQILWGDQTETGGNQILWGDTYLDR